MYWRIWFELYDNEKKIGAGVWHYPYKYKSNAIRAAKKKFDKPRVNKNSGKTYTYKWTVSKNNPWARRVNK